MNYKSSIYYVTQGNIQHWTLPQQKCGQQQQPVGISEVNNYD